MKTLRKIGLAIIAVLVCMNLTACGDDDDDERDVSTDKICGTWTCYKTVSHSADIFDEDGDGDTDEWGEEEVEYPSNDKWIFNTDGTYKIICDGKTTDTGTWQLHSQHILFTEYGISCDYTVEKITDNEMILYCNFLTLSDNRVYLRR